MKKYLGLFLLSIFSCQAFPQFVTYEDAKSAAVRFFRETEIRSGGLKSGYLLRVDTLFIYSLKPVNNVTSSDKDCETALYVFIRENAPGFVILSADQRAQRVIAWSDSSSICESQPGLKLWLEHYAQEIEMIRSQAYPAEKETASISSVAAPLLGNIAWNQAPDPFYTLCPVDTRTGRKCPAGCVATALAEVLYYYKYPRVGKGSFGYHSNLGYLSADFGNSEYKYEEMADVPEIRIHNEEVAELSYHCGIAVETDYLPTGSSAYFGRVVTALENYFKYKKPLLRNKNYYSWNEWETLIRNEIDQKRPVIYSALDPKNPDDPADVSGGHAFIVDGYNDQNQFHINWGWGGCSDGYYALSVLRPAQCGDIYLFSDFHSIITNIEPATSNECILSLDKGQLDFPSDGGTQNLKIVASSGWSVSPGETWLTVSNLSGTGSQTITVTAGPNTGFYGRTATLSVLACNGNKTVRIVQEGACKLNVSAENLDFSDSAASKQLNVLASSSWMASADVSWIKISPESGNGNETVHITVTAAGSTDQRKGVVTFWGCNIARPVTITQGGSCFLKVSTDIIDFPSKDKNQSLVNIISNATWSVSGKDPWIDVQPASGTGNGQITVSVSENENSGRRKGTVILSGCNTVKTIQVSQYGICSFYAAPDYIEMNASPGNAIVNIMTNSPWSAVSNDSWITCEPPSGKENGGLSITVSANTNTGARMGSVIINGCTAPQKITVIQRSSCPLEISTSLIDFPYMPASKTTWITTPGYWTAQSESSWITISPKSGNGNQMLTISAPTNAGETSRQGLVTVSGCSYNAYIDVKQDACEFEISVDSLSFPVGGGQRTFQIKTYSLWNIISTDPWISVNPYYGVQPGNAIVTVPGNNEERRVSLITIKGCYSSKTVEIIQNGPITTTEDMNLPLMVLYPSPAKDLITFSCPDFSDDFSVEAYSVSGEKLKVWSSVRNGERLEIKGMTPGLYLFRISSDRLSTTRKIIIESR